MEDNIYLSDEELELAAGGNNGKNAPFIIYTIKYGDTLSQLAYDHGQTLSEIMAHNKIVNANNIRVGQKIVLRNNKK